MIHNKTLTAAAVSSMMVALAGAAFALSPVDRQFATKAAQGGIFEVKSSQLALRRTRNPQVLMIARRMIRDHSAANKELKTVAMNERITLPTETDPMHRAVIAKLSRQSGRAFDRTYMAAQEKAHTATVLLLTKEIKSGKNAGLSIFATKNLPGIEDHTRMIYHTGQNLGIVAAQMPPMMRRPMLPSSIAGKNPSQTR